jgi:hypothetical protein
VCVCVCVSVCVCVCVCLCVCALRSPSSVARSFERQSAHAPHDGNLCACVCVRVCGGGACVSLHAHKGATDQSVHAAFPLTREHAHYDGFDCCRAPGALTAFVALVLALLYKAVHHKRRPCKQMTRRVFIDHPAPLSSPMLYEGPLSS